MAPPPQASEGYFSQSQDDDVTQADEPSAKAPPPVFYNKPPGEPRAPPRQPPGQGGRARHRALAEGCSERSVPAGRAGPSGVSPCPAAAQGNRSPVQTPQTRPGLTCS